MGKRGAWVGQLLMLWLLAGSTAHGQAASPTDTLPWGRFVQTTVRVGQPIRYELTYRHASDLEVIFPDSTASFAPFELIRRSYEPTRTRQGRSLDRTVYLLRTFSMAPVQQLRLPVLVLRGRDTLTVPALPDSVQLTRTAAPLRPGAPTPTLRANVQPLPVEARFNYPYWLAALVALLLLAGGLVLGFRKSLRRRYQRYRRRKNHAYFLAQYARHVERFELSRSLPNIERAITLWKNYLSVLENNNINSLTTREIVAHYHHDQRVAQALHLADRMIYGNQLTEEETESALVFDLLREFAEVRYRTEEQSAHPARQ